MGALPYISGLILLGVGLTLLIKKKKPGWREDLQAALDEHVLARQDKELAEKLLKSVPETGWVHACRELAAKGHNPKLRALALVTEDNAKEAFEAIKTAIDEDFKSADFKLALANSLVPAKHQQGQ